jgi:4-hydroxybenzoate polyprenyltransferase
VLFDYSRGRQALLSVTQPVLGALLAAGGLPPGRVMGLGLVAASAGSLCVFAANDLFDSRSDRRELAAAAAASGTDRGPVKDWDVDVMLVRHPLAAGILPFWLGVGWVTGLGLLALACAYLLAPICALVFALCFLLEALYCALKYRTWLKTLPAGVMVGLGGLAGWLAVAPLSLGALALFSLLALWEIAGRNLSNDLSDMSRDRPVGVRTLANVHGVTAAGLGILAGALLLPLVAAAQPGTMILRALLALTAVWLVTLPAIRLWRRLNEAEALVFFNRASLFPPAALAAVALALILP